MADEQYLTVICAVINGRVELGIGKVKLLYIALITSRMLNKWECCHIKHSVRITVTVPLRNV